MKSRTKKKDELNILQDLENLQPVLVERKRVDSKKRRKVAGPFSEADYASVSRTSKGDNATVTDDGLSMGATSPTRIEGKANELRELNDLKIQISVESNEEAKVR